VVHNQIPQPRQGILLLRAKRRHPGRLPLPSMLSLDGFVASLLATTMDFSDGFSE
jgi:hypothetical protein